MKHWTSKKLQVLFFLLFSCFYAHGTEWGTHMDLAAHILPH